MGAYRLTHAAQSDIIGILAWSEEHFGVEARYRYEALIATAIRDAARDEGVGHTLRPELGSGVFVWHIAQSRLRVPGRTVSNPRHFLVCLRDGEFLIIGRVLHDSMDPQRHVESQRLWE